MKRMIGGVGFLKDLILVLVGSEAATLGLVGVFGLVVAGIFAAGYVAMNWDRIMGGVQDSVHQRGVEIGQGFSNLGTIVQTSFGVAALAVTTFAGVYSGNQTTLGNISKRIGYAFNAIGNLTHQVWGLTIAGSVAS